MKRDPRIAVEKALFLQFRKGDISVFIERIDDFYEAAEFTEDQHLFFLNKYAGVVAAIKSFV